VQRAFAASRSWRELAVVAEVAGRLVEGFVDLAFEDDGGALVVVDYKTDAVRSAAEVDAAAERYRVQIAAYAAALEAATGRPVSEGWRVFAGLDGVQERPVDLPSARAAMEAQLAG
jgi:ATP-dependent helicase/nuclease subunit A